MADSEQRQSGFACAVPWCAARAQCFWPFSVELDGCTIEAQATFCDRHALALLRLRLIELLCTRDSLRLSSGKARE